jgi:hypothetical protein
MMMGPNAPTWTDVLEGGSRAGWIESRLLPLAGVLLLEGVATIASLGEVKECSSCSQVGGPNGCGESCWDGLSG